MKIDINILDLFIEKMSAGAARNKLLEILENQPNTGSSIKTLERIISSMRQDYALDIVHKNGLYFIEQNDQLHQLVARNLFLKFHTISKGLEGIPNSVDFGPFAFDADLKYLDPIITAIKTRNYISVFYQSFNSIGSKKYKLVPRSLKYWNYRWYLIAIKLPENEFRTFGVDRILKLTSTIDYFEQNAYPETPTHIIGVSNYNLPPEEVVIHIDRYGGRMFQTLTYHPSQRVTQLSENQYQITFNVALNKELIELLCGLHQDFKLIRPLTLIDMMKNHMNKLLHNSLG